MKLEELGLQNLIELIKQHKEQCNNEECNISIITICLYLEKHEIIIPKEYWG